jgi:hypothetical protein
MSFTKLKDRIDKLPLVLAGPMVRRVEPTSATVWLALCRRRRIRLEIYDNATGAVVASAENETLTVGNNLHIACVTAKPNVPFAAGTTYQYDLFFDHAGAADTIQSGTDLFGPRIVSASDVSAVAEDEARVKLTYASDGGPARPSFVLPPAALDQLRLLHGSCRKVAGDNSDALEAADHILREASRGNERRPHMLFLTGDNIYNDGCERKAFKVVLDAAPTLLGWDESMPGAGALSGMSEVRSGHSLDDAGLTNPKWYHLYGLGESIALHLLTFADVLWPEDLDYQRRAFEFRGSLPAVRRALANVATYMIFDDHEFSNSWNITADWVESVLAKPMGRRVFQNALAAYALCQGWGNTPDQFESGAGRALLDAVVDWSAAERAGTSSPADPLARIGQACGIPDVDTFRGMRDWSGFHGAEVVRWDYTVPCPNLNIDVLDAFMWRSYEGATENCLILTDAALSRQIDAVPFPETECSLVVVSNCAIELPGVGERWSFLSELGWGLLTALGLLLFPIWLLLRLIIALVARFRDPARGSFPLLHSILRAAWPVYREEYGSSYEHQTKGFELLMARAAHRAPQLAGGKRQSRVVYLSGDVHRSFCMRMEYWSRVPFGVTADPVEGVLAQLVASPCKWYNPTRFPLKDADVHHWAGWRDEPTLLWTSEPDTSPWRFKKSPWLMEYVPTASQPRMNPDPEWRYSLAPVTPDLPAAGVPLEIPDRPNPTLDDQLVEMESVAPDVLWDIEKAHVLRVNNLADVVFDWTPGSRAVIQQVWWRGRPAINPKWTVSRFVVSMEPPPSPPPLPH